MLLKPLINLHYWLTNLRLESPCYLDYADTPTAVFYLAVIIRFIFAYDKHPLMDNSTLLPQIQRAISKVIDPELGIPITELNLIDKLDITDDGTVIVEYRATTQYCPPPFAFKISKDIKNELLKIDGVKDAKVTVLEHYMSDMINRAIALNATLD